MLVPLADGQFLTLFTDNLFIDILLLFLFLLLFFFSAFFSVAETAYSSANIIRLRNFKEEKKPGAKKSVYLAEKYDWTLTAILIAQTIARISMAALALFFFMSFIANRFWAIVTGIAAVAFLTLVFAEIMPKQYTKENAEKMALRTAFFMYIVYKLIWPLTFIFVKLKRTLGKRAEQREEQPKVTEEDLETIIDVMENEGVIDEDDADLLQSAISLNETTVYDIMTPRVDVVAVSIDDSVEDIKNTFFENQFSRIPVYKDDKDNIVGILSERDFFTAILQGKEISVKKLMSKPLFVSESTKVNDLIKEMQRLKKHFAVVSDEYGGTSGIVTMEDALEELVGEIYDEYDEEEETDLMEIGENRYAVPADMEVEELFAALDLGEAPDTKYPSVGGFVYSLCEGLPTEGQVVHYDSVAEREDEDEKYTVKYHLEFTVKRVENRRIRSVELLVTPVDE
ncbi:MAG TPA: HlyC/CorC family transporter [Acholeplasmataceae bacterium]|nr:HlyC/CorC family transporter [Acholeplasmataceae bacterium]